MRAYNNLIQKPENKLIFDRFNGFQEKGLMDSVLSMKPLIDKLVAEETAKIIPHKFSPEKRKAYTTVGGSPHLDGSYTVFGEVIEGLDVIDKIANAPRDKFDRPLNNISMKIRLLK
jgi:hypothetical protein